MHPALGEAAPLTGELREWDELQVCSQSSVFLARDG